ncbi:prepilin peptidase-dependent protein [Providencia sp. wls1950]|uniref:prepilin peptidase-dependent protein n=1 Tax=Providencia sp. wls1950 TaxID=2675147 RepID=UPI0012B6773E|nr:prepilin peptidase-dependent protein [Providencia sp. wls1950]MTB46452.1 prepilin peptidase-dependent protein [Providencia sp. wls1950]
MLNDIKKHKTEKGFSLLETLIAMLIGCLVCIAAMNTIPVLFKQLFQAFFQYQLDREVRQVLINMEKDFRRIGHCSQSPSKPHCEGKAITISAKFLSHHANSCIIFAYDQDLSGQWVIGQSRSLHSDFFGFRLNNNKLESNRNVTNCDGTRWQSLFDPNMVKVNQLTFEWQPSTKILGISMTVESMLLPNKTFDYHSSVLLRNVP